MNKSQLSSMHSEAMQLVELIIPIESAHLAASYLDDLGLVQFKDLNAEKSPFQRTYALQVKRCEEMARKLRFFRDQITKAGLVPAVTFPADDITSLDDLEVKLGDVEAELVEINSNGEKAGESFQSALSSAEARQKEYSNQVGEDSLEIPLLSEQESTTDYVKLGFVTALIPRERSMAFERILLRHTRGNVFLKQVSVDEPVVDPVSGDKVEKNAFMILFSGERAKKKILRLCKTLGGKRSNSNDHGDVVVLIV